MARSECAACRYVFSSLSSFDKHRTGSLSDKTRRCMTEEEMIKAEMVKNGKGIWATGEFDASVFGKKDEIEV